MQNIKEKLSDIQLGQCVRKLAPWQPSEGGHDVYSVKIGEHFWFLERTYTWSKLDRSFFLPRYSEEAKEIWPENFKLQNEILGVFDNHGRWWVREELSSQFLIPYYLEHPDEYLRVMNNHYNDVQKLVKIIKEVNQTLDDESCLGANIKKIFRAYQLQYGCASTIYYVSDELVWEFKKFLLTFLDKREANIYLNNFLTAEITKNYIQNNFSQEKGTKLGARGILFAADIKPTIEYYPPKFFHSYPQDSEVIKKLISCGTNQKKINRFNSFRQIIPVTVQINEEAHYIESGFLSAHLSRLLKRAAKEINKNVEELEQFNYEEIIDFLAKVNQLNEKKEFDTPIIKGIGASSGIDRGKAKIILNNKDLDNFKIGEILVTKITDPSMVSVMRKAAAIVTDIGGITSHPAIVSREMGIPCVVNTKNATKILNDNQEVKINGGTGEVFLIKNELNKDLDNLIESYRRAFLTMDSDTFGTSINYNQIDPLIASKWMQKILIIIKKAKKHNLSFKEIGKLLPNPSAIRNLAIFDLFMASIAKISKSERMQIAEFYINILKSICLSDHFALDKNNLIHGPEELKNILFKVKPADPLLAKEIGALVNACYQLSYSLYGDMNPQILYENYGPYFVKGKNKKEYLVVIKEFKNLRPTEIWPEINEMPFSKIRLVSIYEKVEFSIDAITHTNYKGDTINNLKYYSLEIFGKKIDTINIHKTTTIIENNAKKIWNKVSSLKESDFRILYLHQKAYNYLNLCRRLGLDWKPTKEMIDEIMEKPYAKWPNFNNPREEDEFFLRIIDPRKDFFG